MYLQFVYLRFVPNICVPQVRFGYLRFVSSSKLMVEQEGWRFIFLRNKHRVALLMHPRKKEKKERERKLTVVSFISKVDRPKAL